MRQKVLAHTLKTLVLFVKIFWEGACNMRPFYDIDEDVWTKLVKIFVITALRHGIFSEKGPKAHSIYGQL